MNRKIYQSHNLPPFIKDGQDFIYWFLKDLFFVCTYVLAHNKKDEYKDLNRIHMQLCDWLDWSEDANPNLNKLLLMSRDTLKSTIGRAKMLQLLIKAMLEKDEYLIGIICGEITLSSEHLKLINWEILNNEMIQAYFFGIVPKTREEAEEMSKDRFRWRKVGIDIGSLKKSLSGRHFRGLWFDNFMNEVNSTTSDLRRSCVDRFKSQGPLLRQDGFKLVSETPWELDDLSGEILDPEHRFDYRRIHRKSPHIFMSKTGYSVFVCGSRNEKGAPNFPEIGGEEYLKDKRSEMGEYYYQRMYELLPISSSDLMFKRDWYTLYDELPWNFFRMIAVDCSGTTNKDSTPSAITTCDWGHDKVGYISYARKEKVKPKALFNWVCKVWDDSTEIGRKPIALLVENEKFGIYLKDDIDLWRPDIAVQLISHRSMPRPHRMQKTAVYAEQGRFKFRHGLSQMKDEWTTYHRDKSTNCGLLDTLFSHIEGQCIPSRMELPTEEDERISEFERQAMNDMMPRADFAKVINSQF